VRVAVVLVVLSSLAAACSGDDGSNGPRSFDLEGQDDDAGSRPEIPRLSAEWAAVSAVVVEAPEIATADTDLDLVVELRNPTEEPLTLSPCPVWTAWFEGENTGLATVVRGDLPCDDIERLEAGERIRLRVTVPAPTQVDCSDGGDPLLGWRLHLGQDDDDVIRGAEIRIPMRESDSSPANVCR
jgi:hypothetical protein